MKITYIHHSCFLVETQGYYYLFDYAKGDLPAMDPAKPIFVLFSHGHSDHYNAEVFSLLSHMQRLRAILSDDITPPQNIDVVQVSPERTYVLGPQLKLTTFRSTDLGVAFLLEDGEERIYHAGDLNDWVWEGESEAYNMQMTVNYRKQMGLLSQALNHREIDAAFVVLDPRQERDYYRGLCYFLENIGVKQVYPMHYWRKPEIIETFLRAFPQYKNKIQMTERGLL